MEGCRLKRTVLIQGGTRGLGLAVAEGFASQGADVFLTYLRNHKSAEIAVGQLQRHGSRVAIAQADAGQRVDNERVFDEVERLYGKLDVVVAGGGGGAFGDTLNTTDGEWRWAINGNAKSLLMLAQGARTRMRNEGGSIVAISSPGADRAVDHYGAIGVAKAATNALVKYLAIELASQNVTVNSVTPGIIRSEAIKGHPASEVLLGIAESRTPASRLVTADDVAAVVMFLAGPSARMITGQNITVDGGLSARW